MRCWHLCVVRLRLRNRGWVGTLDEERETDKTVVNCASEHMKVNWQKTRPSMVPLHRDNYNRTLHDMHCLHIRTYVSSHQLTGHALQRAVLRKCMNAAQICRST